MNFKTVVLVVILAMGLQALVIAVLTKANRRYFDRQRSYAYATAVSELERSKPAAARAIRLCYAGFVVEVIVLLFWQYR
jgi:hypothetical protein